MKDSRKTLQRKTIINLFIKTPSATTSSRRHYQPLHYDLVNIHFITRPSSPHIQYFTIWQKLLLLFCNFFIVVSIIQDFNINFIVALPIFKFQPCTSSAKLSSLHQQFSTFILAPATFNFNPCAKKAQFLSLRRQNSNFILVPPVFNLHPCAASGQIFFLQSQFTRASLQKVCFMIFNQNDFITKERLMTSWRKQITKTQASRCFTQHTHFITTAPA